MMKSGTRIGPYEIQTILGAGGMGEVYRARDTTLHRDVAVKILLASVADDPDRMARFSREAKTLASLNHPNIAQIHGFEQSGGTSALVMELVDGEDLSRRIARRAVPLDEAVVIARQIAAALEAAHARGIIHRDLKPANIKVREDGTVKVLDFGLAKAIPGVRGSAHPQAGATDDPPSATITSSGISVHGSIRAPRPTWRRSRPEAGRSTNAGTSGRSGRALRDAGRWAGVPGERRRHDCVERTDRGPRMVGAAGRHTRRDSTAAVQVSAEGSRPAPAAHRRCRAGARRLGHRRSPTTAVCRRWRDREGG